MHLLQALTAMGVGVVVTVSLHPDAFRSLLWILGPSPWFVCFTPKGWHRQPSSENCHWATGIPCPASLSTETAQQPEVKDCPVQEYESSALLPQSYQLAPTTGRWEDDETHKARHGRMDSERREMSSKVQCYLSLPNDLSMWFTKSKVSNWTYAFSEQESQIFNFLDIQASWGHAVIRIFNRSALPVPSTLSAKKIITFIYWMKRWAF